jgi:hypothetical protein
MGQQRLNSSAITFAGKFSASPFVSSGEGEPIVTLGKNKRLPRQRMLR